MKRIKELAGNKVLRSSALLWVGTMVSNVSNYAFHLVMGRFLGPENYGVLASIVSILYYLMVPTTTIAIIVMKFTAEYEIEKAPGKIRSLLIRLTKQLLAVSAILFVLMAVTSPLMARFLNLDSYIPVLLLSSVVLVTYVLPINRGILQGQQKFGLLSLTMILETAVKITVGISLVLAGFSVNGAIIGIVSAMVVAYAFSFIPLRKIFRETSAGIAAMRDIWKYSIPVFVTLLCLNSYYSIDIILVKHFLPAIDAGHYSGLSILGKIVVFASLAIVGVMFPIVAGRHKAEQKHSHILAYTLALVGFVSGGIVVAYAIAPEFLIKILFGIKYLPVAPYLPMFGAAMLMLSLSGALANYYLAINKTFFVYMMAAVAIVQVVALWFFHGSLTVIVNVMFGVMATLLFSLSAYFFAAVYKRNLPVTEDSAGVPINP